MAMQIYVSFQGTLYPLEVDATSTVNDLQNQCEAQIDGLYVPPQINGKGQDKGNYKEKAKFEISEVDAIYSSFKRKAKEAPHIIVADGYKLTLAGEELSNPDTLLCDVGISAESVIHAEKIEKWKLFNRFN